MFMYPSKQAKTPGIIQNISFNQKPLTSNVNLQVQNDMTTNLDNPLHCWV